MADGAPQEPAKHLTPYFMELRFQLSAAKSAFDSLELHVAKRKEIGVALNRARREEYVPPLEMERLAFFSKYLTPIANLTGPILGDIQAFFAAVGVVNTILWPSPKRFHGETQQIIDERLKRGAEIRALLRVEDTSTLNSRTGGEEDVRGGFLHFDEMIDQFLRLHPGEDFVSFDIGSAAGGTTVKRDSAIRWLDEDTLDLWVNGRHGSLRELWAELARVLGRIQTSGSVALQLDKRRRREPPAPGMAFGTSTRP